VEAAFYNKENKKRNDHPTSKMMTMTAESMAALMAAFVNGITGGEK